MVLAPVPAVLFVCTFNRVRSPMAAGLMRRLYGDALRVDSCGLEPGQDVDPLAAVVMSEMGVDLSGHLPQKLEDLIGEGGFSSIVALSSEAWRQVRAISHDANAIHWPVADPTECEGSREARLEAYRLTRRDLETRIVACFGPAHHAVANGA